MTAGLARSRSLDHLNRAPVIGAGAVHLIDETDARHVVLVGLPPNRFRLRLDACYGVEHDDTAVEHSQRTLNLGREIDVTGRVDDVDPMVLPETGRRSGGDSNATLAFLGHPVHRRRALVYLTGAMNAPGVVEDALRRRRLTGIDMGNDADVPRLL